MRLAALAVAVSLAGTALAADPPAAASAFDPVAPRVRFDLLAPFHADARPGPAAAPGSAIVTTPADDSVLAGGACSSDDQCQGRAYCREQRCVVQPRRTMAVIYYHQPGERGYRHVFPLYWSWWSEERAGRIVAPFYFNFQNHLDKSSTTYVFPLYSRYRSPERGHDRLWPIFFRETWGKDGADGSATGILPLFWDQRRGDEATGAAPLLLTGWTRNSATRDYRALVLGLGWFARQGSSRTAAVLPLFFYRTTPDSTRAVVFPLIWHFANPRHSTTVILPLAVFGSDKQRGLSHGTVFPFFHYRSEENGKRELFVSPLGYFRKNVDLQREQFFLVAPLPIFVHRDPRLEVEVTPLSVRVHRPAAQQTTTVVGPYFESQDPDGATRGLVPLFVHFEDRQAKAQTGLVLPLLTAWHSSPTTKAAFVGPVYGYRGPAGWAGGLFPLLHAQDLDGRQRQYLLPIFYHARDVKAGTDTTAVGPFYYRSQKRGWDAGLFPLAFFGRRADTGYAVVGPFVHKHNADGWTNVLGPLYAAKSKHGYAVGLAPLFHFGARDGAHLRWIAPPLYFHYDDPKTRSAFTMIGPLFRAVEGDDRTQGIFPLAWDVRRGPRRYQFVLPFGGRVHDDVKQTDTLWIAPYLRFRDDKRDATTHVVLPLFVKHDEPDYHVTVLFPIFWRAQDHGTTGTVVFPLYGRLRKPGLAIDTLFPIFWRVGRGDATTTVLGPLFWHRGKTSREAGLLPLFGWGSAANGEQRHAWVAPLLFFHQSDRVAHTSRTLLANFYWERRSDGWTTALVPLFFGWRRGPLTRFITPLSYSQRNADAGTSLDVVGPLYYGTSPHGRSGGLAPLLFTKTWDDGRWSMTLLPLLHAARKKDGGLRVITPLFGWTTFPTGEKGFIGPLYFRKETTGYTAALIPIFYRSVDRLAQSEATVVAPLFLHWKTPARTILAVTPLFWQVKTIESRTSIAFPLFFDRDSYHESRSTGLLPLYVRHHSFADNSTTHVIPPLLMYIRRAPEGTNFALFPLIWRLVKPNGDSTTAVFPIYWDFRRGTSKTQLLIPGIPLYAHWTRDTADHTLVFNVYYRKGKGSEAGAFHVYVIPFFDFGRPRPEDVEWNVLGGLIGYSRIKRERTLKLLWGWEIPLDPAKTAMAPAGSFFTSSPSSRGDTF